MKTLIAGLLLAAAGAAMAQATPAGLWKTIADDGKTEKSLVRISEAGGVYTGKVEKILTDQTDARCKDCSDARKDQPVLGMVILRDIRQDAQDKALWVGGDILDPNNGKLYSVRLQPIDGGKKMEVRGYVGAPLLGRTQTWIRVE